MPGYLAKQAELKAKGVSDVIVWCVNDTAVMDAWAKDQKVGDIYIYMIPAASKVKHVLPVLYLCTFCTFHTKSLRFCQKMNAAIGGQSATIMPMSIPVFVAAFWFMTREKPVSRLFIDSIHKLSPSC